jgi:hypothetical protein
VRKALAAVGRDIVYELKRAIFHGCEKGEQVREMCVRRLLKHWISHRRDSVLVFVSRAPELVAPTPRKEVPVSWAWKRPATQAKEGLRHVKCVAKYANRVKCESIGVQNYV